MTNATLEKSLKALNFSFFLRDFGLTKSEYKDLPANLKEIVLQVYQQDEKERAKNRGKNQLDGVVEDMGIVDYHCEQSDF